MKDLVPSIGIQHPDIFGVFVLVAEFLADDAVLRKVGLDHPAHYGLGRPIGLRDRIEVAAATLVFDVEKRRSEKRQDGFARGRGETINEGGKIDDHHGYTSPGNVRALRPKKLSRLLYMPGSETASSAIPSPSNYPALELISLPGCEGCIAITKSDIADLTVLRRNVRSCAASNLNCWIIIE